jgi:hypothetical protein
MKKRGLVVNKEEDKKMKRIRVEEEMKREVGL